MSTNNLPRVRATVDPRGDYERELQRAIDARREVALRQLRESGHIGARLIHGFAKEAA